MVDGGPDLRAVTTRRIAWSTILANLGGALLVYLFLQFLSPGVLRTTHPTSEFYVSGVMLPAYFLFATLLVLRHLRQSADCWADELLAGGPLTGDRRRLALGLPRRLAILTGAAWAGAAVLWGSLNALFGARAVDVARITAGILLGGVVTSALSYLLAERRFRPVIVVALGGVPADSGGIGIRTRLLTTWLVGSLLPLVALGVLPFEHTSAGLVSVPVSIASLAVIGALAGFFLTGATAQSVSDPLRSVRRALDAVGRGDLNAEVPVDDNGELGRLEAGVNQMVAGLRERRRLVELFGRHVGEAVAQQALAEETVLGGHQRELSVLFVDLIGSTALAASRPPDEVVTVLNRLFGAVVDAATAHGGWVNKFEGDGALCVFGAPEDMPGHAAAALGAARRLRATLEALGSGGETLDAGIGVASGVAVAGNVGAVDRYEYTVIGDPVNESSRLSELAKSSPGRVLASLTAVDAAGEPEAGHWAEAGESLLRGRRQPTVLMAPAGGSGTGPAGVAAVDAPQPPATAGTIDTV